MFLLSKLLPLLVLPLGLSLGLLLLAWFTRVRWPLISAITLLWVFSTGVVSQWLWQGVERPWQRLSAPSVSTADAIVVLSGGRHAAPGPSRVVEWHDPDRFLAGVELFRAGRAPQLLFTGGQNPFRKGLAPEGSLYLTEARALGIPADAMSSTGPVLNTAEEARGDRGPAALQSLEGAAGHECFSHAQGSASVRAPGHGCGAFSSGFSGPGLLGGVALDGSAAVAADGERPLDESPRVH